MITAYRPLREGFLREGRRECLKVSAGDAAGKAITVDTSWVLVGSQSFGDLMGKKAVNCI